MGAMYRWDDRMASIVQLKEKNEKDYYLWVYVYDKAGKQEEWYPKTTCLPEMRGWLCSVTPCNTPKGKGSAINKLNEKIKAYADEKGFAYCDYHKALVDADGVSLKAKYHLYDELHPNPDAYTVMEQIIQPIIKEVLAK